MKKIRNIVPLPMNLTIIEPGTVWEKAGIAGCYYGPSKLYVTAAQAADPRLFEPVEEEFINVGEGYRIIEDVGSPYEIKSGWLADSSDEAWLAIGNVFRCDTNLNPHGVHIDDAIKVFRLALRVPRLWDRLKVLFLPNHTLGGDFPSGIEVAKCIREIEASHASAPKE